MSNGGVLGRRNVPGVDGVSGVWSLREIADAVRAGVWPPDDYFANVVALLHMDGSDTSTGFTDVTGRVWTPSGAAQIRTDLSKFGGSAGQFAAASARITAADAADLRFGTAPWTVEGWFRPQAPVSGFGGFFVKGENSADGISLGITPTVLTFRANGTTDTTAAVSLSTTDFTHIAFVYDGTLIRFFVGGTQVGSAARSPSHTSTAALLVGNVTGDSNFSYLGRIDELRITKGVARYTADFTPPDSPFPNV